MINTIIVPGLDGSPDPHWQSWWYSADQNSVSVAQPDWSAVDPRRWDGIIEATIRAHPGSLVVGHSLGAISLVRLATRYRSLPVRGALLVAPADIEEGDGAVRLGHFAPIPRDVLPFPVTVVASRNDPWIEFSRSQELAASWGANVVDLGNAGHINAEAGFGPWPYGMELRDELLKRSTPRIPNSSRAALYGEAR